MLSKTQLPYQKHLSLRTIRKEWELHHHQAALVSPAVHRRGVANDHEPLDRAFLPEFLLRRLIGMLIEAGIPHSREVLLIWLPLDRVARELFLLILECEEILEDVDQCGLSSQAALTIEGAVPKFGIACFVQAACLTDRGERLVH